MCIRLVVRTAERFMISVTSHTQPRETHTLGEAGRDQVINASPRIIERVSLLWQNRSPPHGSHSFPSSLSQSLKKILKYALDFNLRASNLARCVNLFATKPDNLTLIPDTHIVKVENQSTPQSCSLTQTLYHGAHTRTHTCTHISLSQIKK